MNWRQVSVTCLFVATTSWHPGTFAQADDIRSQITALEREQAALNQQIGSKQKQIETLRSRPSPEQKELADARRAVNEARTAYKTAASSDNESKLKNAEFKYTLAERKYDKANSDVSTLTSEVDQLKQQLASRQRQVKTLQQQATEAAAAPGSQTTEPKQPQKLSEGRARQKQQEQELERSRQQTEAAEREIERLKALLAASENANNAAPLKATATGTTTAVAPAPKPATPTAAESANGLRHLTRSAEVIAALQALTQRTQAEGKHSRDINEVAYFKLQQNGKDSDQKTMASLKALGNGQYRGDVKLNPGHYAIVLGSTRWHADITDISAATEFVVLLDNSDPAKPKLSYYKRTLEGK